MAEICYRDKQEEHVVALDKDTFVIGRSPSCEISISSETISRRHAKLERRDTRFFITDLGSRNGVYVNEEKIVETVLKDGDYVKLGVFEFTFLDKEAVAVESNKTIQQEQKTIMLENPLEKFILKDIPVSEDTYIEKKNSTKIEYKENETGAEITEKEEKETEDYQTHDHLPNLLIFYKEKAFRAVIRKSLSVVGKSAVSDIPIDQEGFPETAFIIKNEKGKCFIIDEYQTGEILYNNVPVIHKRLFDKMIFTAQGVTFQFISNKKGMDSVFEKIYGVFRFIIEKPLIGLVFAAGLLILFSLLLVILLI